MPHDLMAFILNQSSEYNDFGLPSYSAKRVTKKRKRMKTKNQKIHIPIAYSLLQIRLHKKLIQDGTHVVRKGAKKIKAACGLPLCAVGVSHNVLQEFNGSRCQIKIQSVLTDQAFWLPGNPGVIHKHQCFTVNQQTLNWVNTRYMPAYLDLLVDLPISHFSNP